MIYKVIKYKKSYRIVSYIDDGWTIYFQGTHAACIKWVEQHG